MIAVVVTRQSNMFYRLLHLRIVNFMIVGGIGFIANIAIYYPLTFVLQSSFTFLGQQFYLPATSISYLSTISLNYYLNRKYTYKDCRAKQMSYPKYLLTCMTTILGDICLLFLLVQFGHIFYLLAFIVAILIMFLIRYFIVSRWVWGRA